MCVENLFFVLSMQAWLFSVHMVCWCSFSGPSMPLRSSHNRLAVCWLSYIQVDMIFKLCLLLSSDHIFCCSEYEDSGFLQNVYSCQPKLLGIASPCCFLPGVWSLSTVLIISLDLLKLQLHTVHHFISLPYSHISFWEKMEASNVTLRL